MRSIADAIRARTVTQVLALSVRERITLALSLGDDDLELFVRASGLDRAYPAGHEQLFERIADAGGLIVSELPPGAAPTRWRFQQRNRLLAVLSGATVVVEAGHRSSSLNIAGQAHSLGRPVGAVPGPVTSAASAGCHRLIQEGVASLVTDAQDVTDLLDSTSGFSGDRTFAYSPARRFDRAGPGLVL